MIYRALAKLPSEDVRYMHFPALARNGPPTTFQVTSPKDNDSSIGVWYVIQNKWGAKDLVGTSMPRPVTAAQAAQLMAGTGANPPSQWVQQAAFDLNTFMAAVLPVKTESKAAFPRFKKELLSPVKPELSGTASVLAPTTPYQPKISLQSEEPGAAKGRLIKRSLFHDDSNSNSNSSGVKAHASDNGGGGGGDDDDDDDYIKQWEWAAEKQQPEDLVASDYVYDQYCCEEQVDGEVEYDFEPMSQSSGKSAASSSSSSSKMATYVPSADLEDSPMAKKTRTRTRNIKYQ